jgi:8-oxo-dGTP pyrophosphatase MutT (NUDIX family)
MKAHFNEITYHGGQSKDHGPKTIILPFSRVSARMLIVRRSDGAVFAVRHRAGAGMALPGGGLDDGETPAEAAVRELEEERITLVNPDPGWQDRFGVDYYDGYRELNIWFVIAVDGVSTAPSHEIIAEAWVPQDEDPWYPLLRPLILLLIEKHYPELVR